MIATVNDDLLVEPGWTEALVAALDTHPGAAAAQGTNLRMDRPDRVDGTGLAWNRWWQAVQIGHGEAAREGGEAKEIFGVSATAALFRRQTLLSLEGEPFDDRLGSYYEDVDLACRLRKGGYTALHVPQARAHHAGSATGRRQPAKRWALVYGNRYLALSRWLGRGLWLRLPVVALRDLLDLASALVHLDGARAAGILAGWLRAAVRLPAWIHTGPPGKARPTPRTSSAPRP
jgi:GT2 family glycosyltransferase